MAIEARAASAYLHQVWSSRRLWSRGSSCGGCLAGVRRLMQIFAPKSGIRSEGEHPGKYSQLAGQSSNILACRYTGPNINDQGDRRRLATNGLSLVDGQVRNVVRIREAGVGKLDVGIRSLKGAEEILCCTRGGEGL